MSNRSQSAKSSYLEEMQAFNAWKIIPDIPKSDKTKDVNGMQSQGSNIWSTHPICNQIFMQHDNNDKQNEEYKISSSLKTIWNNASESRPVTSNHQQDIPENFAQQMKKITQSAVTAGCVDKLGKASSAAGLTAAVVKDEDMAKTSLVLDMTDNLALVANLLNKGRPITARNGLHGNNYMSNFGLENGNINQNSTLYTPHSILNPSEPVSVFLEKLKLVVENGFLSPKILSEPISSETYDLVYMLIFYVMEYRKTRVYAKSSQELDTHIQDIKYKINLIQKEIAICQSKFLDFERKHQEYILRSLSGPLDGLPRQSQPMLNQFRVPMTREGNSKCNETANNIESVPRKPFNSIEHQNQRFSQRILNRYAQQENVSSSANFMFLPKAKNIENRYFYEQNYNNFSRRDGNSTAN